MKGKLLTAVMVLAGIYAQAQFAVSGSATGSPGYPFNLTPVSGCGTYQAGAMWSDGSVLPATIDFTKCFQLSFEVKLNAPPPYSTDADGFCVVFGQNICNGVTCLGVTPPNGNSAYLGYYDPINTGTCAHLGYNPAYQQSLAAEFDIFNNNYISCFYDYAYDHTQFSINADLYPMGSPGGWPNVQPLVPGPGTIQDGIWHNCVLNWNCSTQLLTLVVDGTLVNSIYLNGSGPYCPTPSAIFGVASPNAVPWGFTGGTGYYCTDMWITQVNLKQMACCCPPAPNVCVTASYSPDEFTFTSSAPGVTIYYNIMNYMGGIVGSGSTTAGTYPFGSICGGYPGATGVCIYAECDPTSGCCWGLPGYPPLPPADACCAHLNPKPAPSGVTNQVTEAGVQLTPNPNSGTFTLTGNLGDNSGNTADVEVIDVTGRTVFKDVAPVDGGIINRTVTLGGEIANGIYIVRISGNGQTRNIKFTLNR